MTGKVRSLARALKQSVIVGFPDGTEAEVPLSQLTWEGRDHVRPEREQPTALSDRFFYLTTSDLLRQRRAALGMPTPRSSPTRWRAGIGWPATGVWFLTGTDEHGDKIAQAAGRGRASPPQGVTPTASRRCVPRRRGGGWASATTTSFRTTRNATPKVVAEDLAALWEGGRDLPGHLRRALLLRLRAASTRRRKIVDGKCPDHLTPLTWIEEENYFFKMSKVPAWLIDEIQRRPDMIRPERYRNEILGFLREPLQDLSISRAAKAPHVGHPAAVRPIST